MVVFVYAIASNTLHQVAADTLVVRTIMFCCARLGVWNQYVSTIGNLDCFVYSVSNGDHYIVFPGHQRNVLLFCECKFQSFVAASEPVVATSSGTARTASFSSIPMTANVPDATIPLTE